MTATLPHKLGEKKMKKTVVAVTLASSLMLAACNNDKDNIVATTAYGNITQGEFYEQIKGLAGTTLLEQVVIDQILSARYAAADDEIQEQFDSYQTMYGDEFESALAENGLTEETFKDNIRFQILQQKAMEDVEITDEEITNYYEQGKYELSARQILVETEQEAQELYDKLQAGEDFAALAKEHSQDAASAENGGELDWFTVGEMTGAFNDVAYALEIDEISEPVASDDGYYIIQLIDKKEVEEYASLEDQKEQITALLKEKKAAETDWATVEARLLKEENVQIKDSDLKGAFGGTEE